MTERKSKALVVYFTFTHQTGMVADAVAETLEANGYDVAKAAIEFTDPKYSKIFTKLPMRLPALRIPTMLPAQRMRKTGEIGIPQEAQRDDYDLVVIGSPTWWLTTNMPIRSYLMSAAAKTVLDGKPFAAFSVSRRYWKGNMRDVRKLGEANGGRWLGETHFVAEGGQVESMLSWLGWMKHGAAQERVFGLQMPPPNLKPDYVQQARSFADSVSDRTIDRPAAATRS
jgi:flavodoxin